MVALMWQVAGGGDAPAVQAATVQAHGAAQELVVKNPLPGPVGRIFQFAFNLPKWVQWGLIALAIAAACAVLWTLYVKRHAIFAWLGRQSTGYKIALTSLAAVMLLGAGGVGYAGNHYMQHNNDFCVGCHVMGTAWGAFQKSEHRKLQCHDCHRQSIVASAKQLYYWIAERPTEIPKHAKVPTAICSECHVQSKSDSLWKRIVATAGHRLHLNSDSASLKNVQCVTCHGQEVHRFKSVDKTCGQSGCHAPKDTRIVLGRMAGQTSQHCTGCHTFSRIVPENISMDSTRKFLLANGSSDSCLGCHAMAQRLKGFSPEDDRGHKGVCGTCHNPHTQTEPKQAYESCASNGCHADLSKTGRFHGGIAVHATGACGQCHKAHEWKTVGRDCIDCHKNIFDAKPGKAASVTPPASSGDAASSAPPTAPPMEAWSHARPAAGPLRPILWTAPSREHRGRGAVHASRAARATRERRAALHRVRFVLVQARSKPAVTRDTSKQTTASPRDTPEFSHKIHRVLACGGCHDQQNAHGTVLVRKATECAACHHSPERSVACQGCHAATGALAKVLSKPVSMRTSANTPPRSRTLPFAHRTHRDVECKSCHTSGILLSVVRDCQSCHGEHHTAERTCATCHAPAKAMHERDAHDGCAGSTCHTNATVLSLPPSRTTCLTCHTEQVNHKPKRECSDCHAVRWTPAARPSR